MPILPENLARYPADWKSRIVPMVRERSGDRCECTGQCGKKHHGQNGRCGAPNGATIRWVVLADAADKVITWVSELEGEDGAVKIVLTVMHLDHTPENNDPANLLHGCQRCHNTYDAPHRRQTRRRNKAAGDLFQ